MSGPRRRAKDGSWRSADQAPMPLSDVRDGSKAEVGRRHEDGDPAQCPWADL